MATIPVAVGQVDKCIKAGLAAEEGTGNNQQGQGTKYNVSKEAKMALHKAATLSILMLTTLAEEERLRGADSVGGKRKGAASKKTVRSTLQVDDVDAAAQAAGFEHLLFRLPGQAAGTAKPQPSKKQRTEK